VRVTTPDDPDGMRSITLVKLRGTVAARAAQGLPAMSLLEVTIKTGRTHQIRVHLASQGHSIVGDDKYGDFDLNKRLHKLGMKRMFLHAWRLQFNHPATGERVAVNAELPPELSAFLPQPERA
jgi:23S rRNA pseudouridine955/2504/2580 synthase